MRVLLCLILIATPAYAQAPAPTPSPAPVPASSLSISGPTTIKVGNQAVLTLNGTTGNVLWLITPFASVYQDGQKAVITGAQGSYQINAITTDLQQTPWTLTIEPLERPLAIAVFDPSALTSLPAGQVAIYQSSTIAGSLAAQGVTWLQYSITDVIPSKTGSTPFGGSTWGRAALAAGLPALVSSVNGVVSAVPLPADVPTVVGTFAGRKR